MASSPTSNGASFVSQPSEQPTKLNNRAAFIWSVADLLRGDYKPHEWGKVILPLTVIRRLDCALQPTKAKPRAFTIVDLVGDTPGPDTRRCLLSTVGSELHRP